MHDVKLHAYMSSRSLTLTSLRVHIWSNEASCDLHVTSMQSKKYLQSLLYMSHAQDMLARTYYILYYIPADCENNYSWIVPLCPYQCTNRYHSVPQVSQPNNYLFTPTAGFVCSGNLSSDPQNPFPVLDVLVRI